MIDNLNINKSNWKLVKLGDVASTKSIRVNNPKESKYKRFVGSSCISEWDMKVKKWDSADSVISAMKGFESGDYLFVRRSTHGIDFKKRVPRAGFDGICSGDIIPIKENKEEIHDGFLIGVLYSKLFWEHAISNASGSITSRVKWKDLAEYEFLLPPKDQQARVAELLWAMDDLILREFEVHEKLVITKKTVSKAEIDFGYNSKSKMLPNNWRMMKIKEFSKVQAGSTPLRSNKDFFKNGKFPWIKTLDLNNNKIYCSQECITQLALDKSGCKLRAKGTVLVAMYGGFNQIGRTGLLEIEAATNQALSAVMVDKKVVMPEFLLLVLNTKVDYWKKVAISSRKDPNITKADVENFPVPIPPLHEQRDILLKSKSMLDSIQKMDSKISMSKAFQRKIINQVF